MSYVQATRSVSQSGRVFQDASQPCFLHGPQLPKFVAASLIAAVMMLVDVGQLTHAEQPDERVEFARDVRPILANHCWSCHGPDESTRQAKLRLDSRESALSKGESGKLAIVVGKPTASEIVTRILATDDSRMPPHDAKKPLTSVQKQTLQRWIEQGAEFSQHWSFIPPTRPAIPKQHNTDASIVNPIDAFVRSRLVREQLQPSPAADRATWLRRVTLDLTGLPPSIADLEDFLEDTSETAFDKVVDRLLASPRFAERMAMSWLDAARFADTNGYNNDETRTMWPWRDWVIEAFAQGMPYDQFLTEQLAGDLIPDATLAQRVATGFNRNHVLTTEGGIIEEEYQAEYVADRIHTTATVFMGLTMQCARCHDHKYDPLTQRDYYQFAAFFNNVPDKVVGYSQGRMAEPLLKVPSREQQVALDSLARKKIELETSLKQRAITVDADLVRWEKSLKPDEITKLGSLGLAAHFHFDEPNGDQVRDGIQLERRGAVRGTLSREPGKLGHALAFDGSTFVEAGEIGAFESSDKFSFAVWVWPSSASPSTVLSKMDEANLHRGYDLILEGGKVASHVVHQWPGKAFKVVTKEPITLNDWHHLVVTYDGSRQASGLKMYVDGKLQLLDVTTNNKVDGTLKTDKPFHIGRRHASAPFQGKIDDVRIYSLELSADDVASLAAGHSPSRLAAVLAVSSEQRSPEQAALLRSFFLDQVDLESRKLKAEQAELPKQQAELDKAIPVTMVMFEQPNRRQTFLLKRGQYDQRGAEVIPGVPGVFSDSEAKSLPSREGQSHSSRLDLARWLTNPSHPLTARVAVNRWWEMLFGIGLVETSEDFGIQGALPSHPDLLDWLATELIRTGWDQRAILKLIVTSATYRQSSRMTPELLDRDPRNRLLARGPRSRLPAESVRDNALAAAGLLRERIGGPSVKPYQPDGLWEEVSVERREKYVVDPGDGLYRRGMYTFWKRTCPPPGMTSFDAPDREFCMIRRARTNTPLQALVLLNDPTFVEAARMLAERVLLQATSDDARLTLAFRVVLCRAPSEAELLLLRPLIQDSAARFAKDPTLADKLLSIGRTPRNAAFNAQELATWTSLMSLLLNLDEAISKT